MEAFCLTFRAFSPFERPEASHAKMFDSTNLCTCSLVLHILVVVNGFPMTDDRSAGSYVFIYRLPPDRTFFTSSLLVPKYRVGSAQL